MANATEGLQERDIVHWEFVYLDSVTLDGQQKVHLSTNPFYKEYDVAYRDFTIILIGKDGEVKLRENAPVEIAKLFEIIDTMPMRQRDIRKSQ